MVQFSNFNRVMDAGNHSKNGASSKSLTSRVNSLRTMKRLLIAAGVVLVAFASCNKDEEEGGGGVKMIDKNYIAMGLSSDVRNVLKNVADNLQNKFNSPQTVSGSKSGSVNVSGTKTRNDTNTGSYASRTESISLNFDFTNFSGSNDLTIISGSGTYSYSYYSSTSGYSSSTSSSWSYNLNSCKFTYTYDNKKYGGTVSIRYSDSLSSSSARVTVEIEGGETFSW